MYDLTKEQKEACVEIMNYFGYDAQVIKTIEELAELQQQLAKNLNNEGRIYDLIQELADVKIMIAQLEYSFDYAEELLKNTIDKKIKRTQETIKTMEDYKKKIKGER